MKHTYALHDRSLRRTVILPLTAFTPILLLMSILYHKYDPISSENAADGNEKTPNFS